MKPRAAKAPYKRIKNCMSPTAIPDRQYQVVHTTKYCYSEPVPQCYSETHLTPCDSPRQACLDHQLTIQPTPHKMDEWVDYFGNRMQFFTIQDRHEEFVVTARSQVQIRPADLRPHKATPAWEKVRDAVRVARDDQGWGARQFVYESPHVTLFDELERFAAPSFEPGRPWLEALLGLTARIHELFTFDPTATNVSTPLETVLQLERGVCQDFAHLQIGCLRAMGLPARYISGYLLTSPPPGQPRLIGADASHAWLSAYCPELGWVEFDPTNNLVPSLEHITVGYGRDYSDVCPIKGVFIGGGDHSMQVSVDVQPLDEAAA